MTSSSRTTVTWSYGIRRPPMSVDGYRWKRTFEVQRRRENREQPPTINRAKKRTRLRTAASGHDLLDANESTWTFGVTDRVGGGGNPQASRLDGLVSDDHRRNYCGRTADVVSVRFDGEREGAGPFEALIDDLMGTPTPLRETYVRFGNPRFPTPLRNGSTQVEWLARDRVKRRCRRITGRVQTPDTQAPRAAARLDTPWSLPLRTSFLEACKIKPGPEVSGNRKAQVCV
jgi:hypothetical protein